MPRQKKGSKSIDHAERRLSVLNTLEPDLDLGNGVTVKAYTQKTEQARNSLNNYNASLTTVDQNLAVVKAEEKELDKLTNNILTLVKVHKGEDSELYKQLRSVQKQPRNRRRSTETTETTETKPAV